MWPFPKKSKSVPAPSDTSRKLHGYNLDTEWHYLGLTRFSVSYVEILFFVSQKDEMLRDYAILGNKYEIENFKRYSPHYLWCEIWKACENNGKTLYGGITTTPSEYLKSYMLDKGNWIWDEATKWWICAPAAVKYEKAIKTQKKTEDVKLHTVEQNVVSVDFTKRTVDNSTDTV